MSLAHAYDAPRLAAERPEDGPAVERLILEVFGPGRLAKAAERLREGRQPVRPLSFVAWEGAVAVGCVRQWALSVGAAPALLLGPLAVRPDHRSRGLGGALIEEACRAASAAGVEAVLLVGDAPFYAPYGFVRSRGLTMPGPVDPARLLVRSLSAGAGARLAGLVTPA